MVLRTIGVAVAIPEPHGSYLQSLREGFGDPLARAIPTHVTLLPPTEVRAADLPAIEEHLLAVAASERQFTVRLRGAGTFRPVSPVVFVQVATGVTAFERIEAKVRSGPLARELRFPYHPHVTVAHDVPDDALEAAFEKLGSFAASFPIFGYSLYAHGPDKVWRPQRDFTFGGSRPHPEPRRWSSRSDPGGLARTWHDGLEP